MAVPYLGVDAGEVTFATSSREDVMPRLVKAALALCALWLAFYELRAVAFPTWHVFAVGRGAHLVELGLASGLCLLRGLVDRRERWGWLLIGLGCAAWTLGETYFTVALWNLKNIPVPSLADAGYLAFPPLVFAGIVVLARRRIDRMSASVWIDGAAAALAVAALSASLVFDPVLHSVGGSPAAVATNLAYPVSDMLLLGLLVGVVALSGWRLTRTWSLLGIGVIVFWIADSLYLVHSASATYTPGGVYDIGWWGGITLLAAAAWMGSDKRAVVPAREQTILLPLAFGVISLGVLISGDLQASDLNLLAVSLAGGSLTAIGVRLYLTFRHNERILSGSRKAARTDSLTTLPNRRALTDDLTAALAGADDARPVVLAMFDLDGFKSYNDTFGHPAGDDLLRRLSTRLAAAIRSRGTVYRLGGDEFCALIHPHAEPAQAIIEAAVSALTEHGQGFTVGCSYGALSLPREAATSTEALALADRRMYNDKHRGRQSASRQSADVLVRALAERIPDLEGHLSDVATLAGATAERLGLEIDEVEVVQRAAELHDVGKVAIPDAILNKPAALDESEMTFMRQHPIIGERILAAAPSLAPSAPLVRATHEWFNGSGYPDGLVGDQIPLGSRIIAVCDAFEAMTSYRPYRKTLTALQAQDELRRSVGTQFDPVVVDAFCRARERVAAEVEAVS
ncbi:MAG TPA: HD domain-containing phosphohydrolase [Solirubrobacteraceae bacterium]|nr:HD domain-containing phosphohydrolase [Solirubrobacteraceae bacterium]